MPRKMRGIFCFSFFFSYIHFTSWCDMTDVEFLIYLEIEKRYSNHTIVAYKRDIEDFKSYINDHNVSLSLVQPDIVRGYIICLMDSGLNASSVSRKLSALRSLYKFAEKRGMIPSNPVRAIKAPKLNKRLPSFVEEKQMTGLLDHGELFNDGLRGLRDRLVLELLFDTGIRLSELLQIKVADIDTFNLTLKVVGKRNKERIIPVPTSLGNLISNFLKARALEQLAHESDKLIITAEGKAAYSGLIYRIVKKYLSFVTTQDQRGPHVLRHSYATSLLNRGADLNAIKELLGHESLAATQVYVHNSIERLKSVYKQAHPKA